MIYYLYPFVGRGRLSIAVCKDGAAISLAVAYCSPKDQFTRARGRTIAHGRLQYGLAAVRSVNGEAVTGQRDPRFFMGIAMPDEAKREDVNLAIANAATCHPGAPSWARRTPSFTPPASGRPRRMSISDTQLRIPVREAR